MTRIRGLYVQAIILQPPAMEVGLLCGIGTIPSRRGSASYARGTSLREFVAAGEVSRRMSPSPSRLEIVEVGNSPLVSPIKVSSTPRCMQQLTLTQIAASFTTVFDK